ncbi:ATP synthase subunit I [Ferviditalea candida]|uniref:ATP synthase subunit I n=1 Tax=Ferviditalea candida TaxID=3108399 RepID=A0ABU5ZJ22_9BACL|nr:ATP synthase subunit I [Paenibacillaceae bacterium T2]
MLSFQPYVRSIFFVSFMFLLIACMIWFLFPAYRPFAGGYILGAVFSVLNGLILAVKTVHTGEYALKQRSRRPGTGLLQRFLLAGFAGFTAFKYPAFFHPAGVILGLSSLTVLSLLLAFIYYLKKDRTTAERGEK